MSSSKGGKRKAEAAEEVPLSPQQRMKAAKTLPSKQAGPSTVHALFEGNTLLLLAVPNEKSFDFNKKVKNHNNFPGAEVMDDDKIKCCSFVMKGTNATMQQAAVTKFQEEYGMSEALAKACDLYIANLCPKRNCPIYGGGALSQMIEEAGGDADDMMKKLIKDMKTLDIDIDEEYQIGDVA